MFKNNGGFTLVELIVVIAILAILAGVAVPAYSAYINNANETADDAALNAIETAMSSALSFNGVNTADAAKYFTATLDAQGNLTVAKKSYDEDATDVPANLDKVWTDLSSFYGKAPAATLKFYKVNAAGTGTDVPALLGYVAVTVPEDTDE